VGSSPTSPTKYYSMAQKSTSIQPNRKKKLPKYESFRLTRRIAPEKIKQLPSALDIWKDTLRFLWKYRVKMLTFTVVYALAYLIFVKGLSGFNLDVSSLKTELNSATSGNISAILTAFSLYGSLLSSLIGTADAASNFFQTTIILLFSLSFIWLLRKLHHDRSVVTVKEAFYVGMRPLIPFVLVILIMILELLPAALGSFVLVTGQNTNSIAGSNGVMILGVLALLTFILSIYLLTSSVFALYIVTLPKATPLMAIRSSMNLLRIHRWIVLRKILSFYVFLFIAGFVLVLPFILWIPRSAEVVFFVMGSASFGVMHTYMYKLYRSMIS
jgi:hypothetical protein